MTQAVSQPGQWFITFPGHHRSPAGLLPETPLSIVSIKPGWGGWRCWRMAAQSPLSKLKCLWYGNHDTRALQSAVLQWTL